MKFSLCLILSTLIASYYVSTGDKSVSENEHVKCDIVLKQKELRAGELGYFLILFKPKKGIRITTDPPFQVSLDTTQQFFSLGKAEFSQDANGYLNSEKAVRQSFTITRMTKPGSYALKGTLIYYYCSDGEGWCSRFIQPIELKLMITK